MSRYSTRFDAALCFAAVKHDGQNRKSTTVPYLVHPVHVARLLEAHGFDEDTVIAGLLHDVLEDTACTRAEVAEAFGESVAETVVGCSEPDKSKPWEERKAEAVERMRVASPAVRAVACADKAHNMHTIADALEAGSDPFARFKRGADAQLDYHRRALASLADGWEHPILDELRTAIARVERATAADV